jgi:Domain of unknown function (DUF4826)
MTAMTDAVPDPFNISSPAEQQAWLRSRLDSAVQELIASGIFRSATIEVKPAWVAPGHYLIGKAREAGDDRSFRWFIRGEGGNLDHVPGDAAATAREAARHFSLKWHLDATRSVEADAAALIKRAELLYALVDDERFWQG